VTVASIKLEQSSAREVMSGTLPERVPVTALAQLFALHSSLSKVRERVPWPKARTTKRAEIFMLVLK
jgi:hypothetical protein